MPGGGIYIWLVADPESSRYPEVACSVHYAGLSDIPSQEADEAEDTSVQPGEETSDPPGEDASENPADAMEQLLGYVKGLDLPKKVEKALLNKIEQAKKMYEKDQIKKSFDSLDSFQKQIQKHRKDIKGEDEAYLNLKAGEIQEMLK